MAPLVVEGAHDARWLVRRRGPPRCRERSSFSIRLEPACPFGHEARAVWPEEEPWDPADHRISLIACARVVRDDAIRIGPPGQSQRPAAARASQQWDTPIELAHLGCR